jgi:hypothetical protein
VPTPAGDAPDWDSVIVVKAGEIKLTGPITVKKVTEKVTVQAPAGESIIPATDVFCASVELTMTGSPKQMTAGSGNPKFGVVMTCPTTNTTPVRIGGSSVSSTSYAIYPGGSFSLGPITPLNTLWFLGKSGDLLFVFAL